MKFIIDDANVEAIKNLYEYFPVEGVTTNPSILAKSRRSPYEVLKEIREFIGKDADLHVQVVSKNAADMVTEAVEIQERLRENTFIKVPTTREGLKAMKLLSAKDVKITATAIYTPMQAFLAAKAGAAYAAPYVNRIDNLGADGIETVKKIHDIFQNNGLKTEVLAASFKNSQQVLDLCAYGIGAATIAPDVIEGLIRNDAVISAVDVFTKDFEGLCGEGKTMRDC